jgi:hypothetical protein
LGGSDTSLPRDRVRSGRLWPFRRDCGRSARLWPFRSTVAGIAVTLERRCHSRWELPHAEGARLPLPSHRRQSTETALASTRTGWLAAGMADEFKHGDPVEWSSHGVDVPGEVEKKVTERTEAAGRTVAASEDNPQYVVKSDKSGKKAVHKPDALRKEHEK